MVEIIVVAFIWVFLAQVFGGASQSASSTNFSDDNWSASAFDDDDDFWHRSHQSDNDFHDTSPSFNPANGLPMMGCIDIAGNAYGTDSSHWDDHSMSSSYSMDDSFTSSSSMFDDSFSSSSFDDSFSSSSYSSFDD